MATMPMTTPRSLILLLLLRATPFFLLLPHPSFASLSDVGLSHLIKKDSPQEDTEVVVLTAANFSSFLAVRRHVVVDFYAPWCYWSRKLAPEYAAAAAAHLADKGLDVALAKVDATQDRDLGRAHGVDGYPTVLFFVDGVPRHSPYYGERTKDAMVSWISERLGPEVQNVNTIDEAKKITTIDEGEAKKIINGHGMAVLAFLDSLSVCPKFMLTKPRLITDLVPTQTDCLKVNGVKDLVEYIYFTKFFFLFSNT